MPKLDVTARVLETLRWMVKDQLRRRIVDDFVDGHPMPANCSTCAGAECPRLFECAASLPLSPEMTTAVALLADLETSHITCVRDTPTSDY